MKANELTRFKERLLEARQALLNRVSVSEQQKREIPITEERSIPDMATIHSSQELRLELSEKEREKLRATEEALEKVEQGIYGICEECEEDIAVKRLEVLPFARYCVNCQDALERVKETSRTLQA